MHTLHTDNSALAGPDEAEISKILKDIKAVKLNITTEGGLEDFLPAGHEHRLPEKWNYQPQAISSDRPDPA
jgi:hypothetical protein